MSLLFTSNAISTGGYTINNSLRFRASASAYLNRTPAVAGNQQIFTWSGWVKIGYFSIGYLQAADGNSGNRMTSWYMRGVGGSGTLEFEHFDGTTTYNLASSAVFRDPSAWYHIVVAVDTTQATAANRTKIYVNNTQQTFTGSYVPQNTSLYVNGTTIQAIGSKKNVNTGYGNYFDGYMAEVNFIDGQQLTPSSFGTTDPVTGVWSPAKYTGTYGTNGFYLPFSDTSALTTSSNVGLGKDFSGNGNYWATNNISITSGTTYDAMIDSPTQNLTSATQPVGNYCTLNPVWLLSGSSPTFSEANLKVVTVSTGDSTVGSTIGMTGTGKYYAEFIVGTASSYGDVGIINITHPASTAIGNTATSYNYRSTGVKGNNSVQSAYGASYTTNDVIGVAFDVGGGTITFYKNGVSQGTAFTGIDATQTYTFAVGDELSAGTFTWTANFGQRPFAQSVPSGYQALCTTNLPDSTILKGNKYMDATLYTGNGTSQTITNAAGFKPDLFWVKGRSYADFHVLEDTVRGVTQSLSSNLTTAEVTRSTAITAFTSTGFTVGSDTLVNYNANTVVAWQWQAGQGTTSSNTSGSITSTVSVSTTAGFSIVTYTGTGANATVGHGLGVAPKMIIAKGRGNVDNWGVYHASANASPATGFLYLNGTQAFTVTSTQWNNTAPTSTVFSIGTDTRINQSTIGFVAYCFAEIAGFSKFSSYTGNGSTDGPFVYLGFRPKYILIKRSSAAGDNWNIMDSSRNTYNITNLELDANSTSVEQTGTSTTMAYMDFLSNGFKMRTTSAGGNASGSTYIYAAFAENPFKNALAR